MANEQLESFLTAATADAAPAAPEPEPVATTTGDVTPEPKAEPDAAKPDDQDDDGAPPAPLEGEAAVPMRVFVKARNDFKERAAKAEGRIEELVKQLEAAKAAPLAQPVQQVQQQPVFQPPQVSFQEDPEGYIAQFREEMAMRMLSHRADVSQANLVAKIGADKVEEMQAEFHRAAAADPTLYVKARQQLDPFAWAHAEVERMRVLRDVGDDPASYRARIEAEVRAKLEAEMAAQPQIQAPVVSPAAGQPRSLANVRSVAARAAPVFTGEPSITEILAGIKR